VQSGAASRSGEQVEWWRREIDPALQHRDIPGSRHVPTRSAARLRKALLGLPRQCRSRSGGRGTSSGAAFRVRNGEKRTGRGKRGTRWRRQGRLVIERKQCAEQICGRCTRCARRALPALPRWTAQSRYISRSPRYVPPYNVPWTRASPDRLTNHTHTYVRRLEDSDWLPSSVVPWVYLEGQSTRAPPLLIGLHLRDCDCDCDCDFDSPESAFTAQRVDASSLLASLPCHKRACLPSSPLVCTTTTCLAPRSLR
jgi:hypothetical protein